MLAHDSDQKTSRDEATLQEADARLSATLGWLTFAVMAAAALTLVFTAGGG